MALVENIIFLILGQVRPMYILSGWYSLFRTSPPTMALGGANRERVASDVTTYCHIRLKE